MPLKSSGLIVVEKPSSASVCVSQQQQQLLFATTTTSAASTQKPVAELKYCEYYETNDAQAQQKQQHAVVVEHNNGSTQQQHLMRRQQQRNSSASATSTIQQFNLKQPQQQPVQHMGHHAHQQQQQHVVQQQQQPQQVIQVSDELYEQAAAAAGNMMISTTGEMLNQQYFKIVTPDGSSGNMIIGNVTAATSQNAAAAGTNNSKVLLSNVTMLSKQSTTTGAATAQQQQPQTINFVSTKNLSYLTTTASGGTAASSAGNGSKQQKLTSSVSSYKASTKQQQQQHVLNNATSATTTTTYIQQPSLQQHVPKLNVPRNVQMVTRVQTLIPQQQQQQPQLVMQPQAPQQQPPQKYVVPAATKTGNTLKKSSSMKMSQHKLSNNISQSGSVKTFIQQQPQSSSNSQQHQGSQYQTTNKVKSQKIVKQYNNAINNSTGAVSIATLPQHQQQHQANHTALATYTINHKVNNHQQQSTKITKLANPKYMMHNNQQQPPHIISSNTTATLPHGTQIHHKSMQQLQHSSTNSNINNNIIMQQQQVLTTGTHANGNAGTIKFVNAHGTVIHQHHQQNITQKQQRQVQQNKQQPQQYAQQLQFVETPVAADNIYQLATATSQQQPSPPSSNSSSCSQSLISDDIMIVNGTQMTDELSARILQSMAQNSFGNQQRYQQQQQQQHQTKCSTISAAASSVNMPPPQQIVLQHLSSNAAGSAASQHLTLSPKEYPIYNPAQHQQQQQQQQTSNYMATSCTPVCPSGPSGGLGGGGGTVSSGVANRQSQCVPGSRSHSMERKLHETSITKKSSDYFKVNNNNIVTRSGTISLTNSGATFDAQTTIQSMKTVANTTNEDDAIGEEVRPVLVNTHDIRLQILHAVLQDHTYANPTPTRFPTELMGASNTSCQSMIVSAQAYHTAPVSAVSVTSTYGVPPQQQASVIPTKHWSLGGIAVTVGQNGSAGAASTSLSLSDLNAQTLLTSSSATSYTLYGQQIPRLQQDDDANSAISNGSRVAAGDIDPGEETETAPEAEDDSVTRCICDLTHDDGYMICCDKCSAWQHVDCMGIDRQNIPDEYLCELCQPRQVDKERARSLQLMKRKEQQTQLLLSTQTNSAASEGALNLIGSSSDVLAQQKRLAVVAGGSFPLSGGACDTSTVRGGSLSGTNASHHGGTSASNKKGKVFKKTKESGATNKKSKKAEKLAAAGCAISGKLQRKETKKNTKRKTKSGDSLGNGNVGGTAAERHAANLRQWIENYELAVTNHYSPELRARLHAISKQPNLLQSITNTENKALKNCGRLDAKASTVPHAGGKILITNLDISPNCPILELRGKYMLTTQYKTQNASINMNSPPPSNYLSSFKAHKIPGPFIFFYQLPGAELPLSHSGGVSIDGQIHALQPPSLAGTQHLKGPEICVDTRTYGNEARFVRRSCRPNAEIQHLFEKGTIHLFIVSLIDIRASTEITLRHEPHDLLAIEHKKSSQLVIQPTSTACACGLTKDCLFGPPLQQPPTPAAVLKSNRKATTLNGSSAAAVQLTMGGLAAPGIPFGKKKFQNINRNRSTSSSGDSNMGLNSPNILLHSNISSNGNNLKSLNMLSSSVPFISATAATSMSNAMHDSGICTSSSSPSVSIPSPSSHMHSPTHQQQQCVQPLQQQTTSAIVQQRPLVMPQAQQQQQHHQILAALPTTMLLSPHQLLEQPQVQTPTLSVVATAASAAPNEVTMPQVTEQNQQQEEDTNKEQIQQEQNIYVKMNQQNTVPEQQNMLLHENMAATTNLLPTFPAVAPSLPLTATNQNINTLTEQQNSPALQHASASDAELLKHNISDQQQLQPQQKLYPATSPSPISSPQKQSTINITATHSARKTSVKQFNSSRTTSTSEDAASGPDHHQQMDCDTTASTQSPSSSNNTTLTSPKEKPKLTRDERKMEAILRAIEKMEKNSLRKQELKQTKRVTKRRQSNNSKSSPSLDKQRSTDGPEGTQSTSTGVPNRLNLKKNSSAYVTSRKKKRKSHKKSYNMHSATAQRKRRKSSFNSNESAEATESPAVMDTNVADTSAAVVTSESESNSVLPTFLQPMVGASTDYSCTGKIPMQQLDNNRFTGSKTDIGEATSNVDQAAGLLMAFANPNNSVIPQEEPNRQAAQHSPVHYMLHDDVFKSPSRLQTTRDLSVPASPPPTPPAPVSSACLLLEAAVGPLEPIDQETVEFKYPTPSQTKTKKVLMSNWLHQSDVLAVTSLPGPANSPDSQPPPSASGSLTLGLDSLVQAAMSDYKPQEEVENLSMVAKQVEEFIQQTEYPPPLAEQEKMCPSNYMSTENYHTSPPEPTPSNYVSSVVRNLHLPLQVSTCSNNSSVKKRWLRQAISEETDECSLTPSSTSILSTASLLPNNYPPLPNGFTAPLKKRRLVISSKDEEQEHPTPIMSPPPSVAPTTVEPALLFSSAEDVKLESGEVDASMTTLETNTDNSTAYVDAVIDHVSNRDDESEIVDVGNNDELARLNPATAVILHLPPKTTMNLVLKGETPDLSKFTQLHSSPVLQDDFKPEIPMEQDDDVDILRSPSPGSQKMVAEDNLVKIEPEDVGGSDDVKIDVEREESEAFDKFEEIMQMKSEEQKCELVQDTEDTKVDEAEVKVIKDDKIKMTPEEEITEETLNTDQASTTKVEVEFNSFKDQLQLQCKPLLKTEEPIKKKPKLQLQFAHLGTSSSPKRMGATGQVTASTTASLPIPAPPTPSFVSSNVTALSEDISSSTPSSPPSTAVVSTSNACKTANADSTSSISNRVSRNSLSDDDIQERLHSFHKENILFLQSRNKKTKISSTSTSPSSSFKVEFSKHSVKDSKNSPGSKKQQKSSQNMSSSSRTKKLLKKERSSSGSKSSSSKRRHSSGLTNSSSSHHSSSSASNKLKSLKKSHSASSTSNLLSSSHPISSSMAPVISTTTTNDKEKNRSRSLSASSVSSCRTSSTKKRQLNFEQELSKDMLMCSSSGSSSGRHRREDAMTSSFSSTSAKKSRESSSSGSSRMDENRSNKHKNTTSNSSHNNPDNSKLYIETVHLATGLSTSMDLPTTATTMTEANIVIAESMVMSPMPPMVAACTSIGSTSTTHCSQKMILVPNAPPAGSAKTTHIPAEIATALSTPIKCTNSLPYYNTIYGKLLDDSYQQVINNSAAGSSSEVVASNCLLSAANSTASAANECSTMLSEYLDTKVRSYNSLGGYVSHTALFGLSTSTKPTNIKDLELRELNTNPTVVTMSVTGTTTTLELQTTTSTPSAVTTPTISPVTAKPSTPIKILTKTASHDPRLNPILTAPEPQPAPKRKLSINEYRKRKQQTTSSDSLSCAIKEKSLLGSSFLQTSVISKYSTIDVLGKCGTLSTSSSPSPNSSYISTINKCTLNSPERSFEIIKERHEKSLNDPILINSGLSFANVEIPRMRITEEDTSKVQFSAAPTLLEKQQEKFCERLKSLKNKQSAADLVTGRLNAIGNDFGLKKDDDMFHNRSSISDLDSCLEAISSSSTSMASSRESTPERSFSRPSSNHQYNETTTATYVKTESNNKNSSGGGGAEALHHQLNVGGNSLNSVVATAATVVETTSSSTITTTSRNNYELA